MTASTILIVDDDARMVKALAGEIRRMGYDVETCESADAAIEQLLNSSFDLLLTDLRMAGRDGIDLIKMAGEISPNTRSVLMSAYATARDYKTAIDMGAVEVLTKPFTPDDLGEALRKAIESSDGFQGNVHGLSLTDILQMFHFSRRSMKLQVGADGAIHLVSGEIHHAERGDKQGREALVELLRARSGSVRTAPAEPCARTLDTSFDALLLDVMREIDEGPAPKPAASNVPTGGEESAFVEDEAFAIRDDEITPTTLSGYQSFEEIATTPAEAKVEAARATSPREPSDPPDDAIGESTAKEAVAPEVEAPAPQVKASGAATQPTPPTEAAVQPARKRRLPILGIVTILAFVAGIALFATIREPRQAAPRQPTRTPAALSTSTDSGPDQRAPDRR
ncbi:MAG: response regulator [Myxococcales bacterium]|nr:response regulator [Myxococcales bacterium]